MSDSADVRALLDRAEIHDVLMRYFHGADSGNREVVRACFTEDVAAHYDGREPTRGVDALIGQISLFENLESGACKVSTHFVGNVQYKEIAPDTAETETNAFAFLVARDGSTVAMRSLRYLDQLRREEGKWKIAARLHTLDWSCDVPCTFARPFADKLIKLPAHLIGG
jgi:hypothetical protein